MCSPRLDVCADLHLMIRAEERGAEVADGRLQVGAVQRQVAELGRRAAQEVTRLVGPADAVQVACAGPALVLRDEATHPHVPDGVGRHCVRKVTECDRRHRGAHAHGGFERPREGGLLGIQPEFLVKALNELPRWCKAPRELSENLVLLVGSRTALDRCRAGCRSRAGPGNHQRTRVGFAGPARQGWS